MKLWKWLTGLFFLLVIVDGTLRKWVFPGYPTFFLVLKDFVLWGGFAIYALNRSPTELPRPLRRTWIPVLLGAYVSVVLLQAFNLRQPSLVASAIGVKAHLAYIPLVVLLPPIVIQVSEDRMERFLWGYALFIFLPIAALGIYQFYQPPTAWINTYVRNTASIDTLVKGVVRITGTFSYIGSFTPYLSFSAFLSGTILLAGLRWERERLAVLGGLLLTATFILLPMTGSRSVVIVSIGGLLVLFLGTRVAGKKRLTFLIVAAAVGLIVVQGGIGLGLEKGWATFGERVERTGGVETMQDRTVSILSSPLAGLRGAGLFGYGVGSTHQATSRFVSGMSDYSWLPGGYIESGLARVIIELGIPGWLILLALKGTLAYLAYQVVNRSRSPVELIIGGTAFCVLLSGIVQGIIFNLVRNALYWGAAGAMLGIWSLQQVRSEFPSVRHHGSPKSSIRT